MLRMVPSLRPYAEPLTNAMVEFYTMSQERFTQVFVAAGGAADATTPPCMYKTFWTLHSTIVIDLWTRSGLKQMTFLKSIFLSEFCLPPAVVYPSQLIMLTSHVILKPTNHPSPATHCSSGHATSLRVFTSWDVQMGTWHLRGATTLGNTRKWRSRQDLGSRSTPALPGTRARLNKSRDDFTISKFVSRSLKSSVTPCNNVFVVIFM